MPRGRKPSSKPNQLSEVKEEVEVIHEVKEISVNGQVIEKFEVKKYPATGKFYAKDGFVIGKEGQIVSKKMEQYKAEEIAQKFNK